MFYNAIKDKAVRINHTALQLSTSVSLLAIVLLHIAPVAEASCIVGVLYLPAAVVI